MPGADNHGFCRLMLTKAREDAATAGVEVPKGLKALRSTKRHFFEQCQGWPRRKGLLRLQR